VAPGTTVNQANLSVDYSPYPIPSYYPSYSNYPAYNPWGVGRQVGQACGGEETYAAPPAVAAVFNGLINNGIVQNNVPNIQAADQQCVPAAFANGLQYMAATYGVTYPGGGIMGLPGRYGAQSPAINNPGFFVPTFTAPNQQGPPLVQNESGAAAANGNGMVIGANAISQVGMLDKDMSRINYARSPTTGVGGGGNQNEGVAVQQQLNGLIAYIAATGNQGKIGILTEGVPLTLPLNNPNGVAVTLNNSPPSWSFIQQCLASGDAVEGAYAFPGGAHAVDIVGAGLTLGVPWIRYQSDWVQTGNDDPFDALLVGNPATDQPIHSSIVLPTYLNNPTLGQDGLVMLGEANMGNGFSVLQDVTVLYLIPEPSTIALVVIGIAMTVGCGKRRGHPA